MRCGLSRAIIVAIGVLLIGPAVPSLAGPVGQPSLTPDLQVPPIRTFRIDMGVLGAHGIHSIRSRLVGDLWGPYLAVTYAAAPNVALTVDGMPFKAFEAYDGGGGTTGVGDFTVWVKALLGDLGKRESGYGLRFGAKLPNTPSNKDFGTNQTDFFMHLFAGRRLGTWTWSVYSGIGILERPRGEESQDDVLMIGVLTSRALGRGRLSLEAEGFSKSRIYGDNWGFHTTYEHPLGDRFGVLVGAQLSKGRLYGKREARLGLTWQS